MAMDPQTAILPYIIRVARFSGNIEFRGLIKIEGEAEGEITGDEIEIAPSALVTARITANRLKIAGQVDGDIVARERIEVLPTGRVRSAITTPTLVIAEGALFDGHCTMHPLARNARQTESHQTKNDGVSLFVTPAERTALRKYGYSDNDIFRMNRAEAQRLLRVQ
jgi:cytoskeletal protein CcmA (bactofilin family)